MTLENFSINTFTNTITNTLGMFWDTAKSYLTVESAHDDEGKITEVHQQIESGSSFISTLQQSASWFRYQPKKLLMLTGLALAYYANQTGYDNNSNKELNISYTIGGMDFTSYVPFQAVSNWDYLIPSSTGTLAQFAMVYGASNLLSQSYQYNAANLFIAPLSLMVLSSFLPVLPAQTIESEFFKVFGGNLTDYGYAVKTTSTGEIVVAGWTYSFGAEGYDALVAKFYANSSLAWARTLGGSGEDAGYALALTPSGDIVVAGPTNSFGAGNYDVLVAKLNASGSLIWARTLGGSGYDEGQALAVTPSGDIVVVGYTLSFGTGNYDALVAKFYTNGSLAWARTLGGSGEDAGHALALTPSGDIVVAGPTNSFGAGNYDVLVAKLNASGNLIWARTLGGSNFDDAQALALTLSGDIVVAGSTNSFFGAGGNGDVLVTKLYSNGSLIWARTLGGSGEDAGYALALTPSDDIMVAGSTNSGAGNGDVLVTKLYNNGSLIWARTLGGSGEDASYALALTPSDDIVLTGQTNSFGAGSNDVLLAKFDVNGTIPGCNLTGSIQPTVLSWGNITNSVINSTFMSLNTTGLLQDWMNISTQFITPQSLSLCFAQKNGSMNTPPSSSQGSANSLTDTSSSVFSASTLPTSSTLTSTLSTSDISTSVSSTSVDATTTNNPSSASTSLSASQSSSAYSFNVSVSTTPLTIEQGISTTLTSNMLSISGNVPPSQVIYTIIGNNPDILITVNGLEVTQFTQEDVEGNFVEIAIPGVTCGDDYSTDLQLEANIAGSNAPAQQASVNLVLDITTCSYAGRFSLFSYRDTQIGFWANNKPKEQIKQAEQKTKLIQSIRENMVNPINFKH